MKKLQLADDCRCFACGMENPDGLRIEWKTEGLTTFAEFIADQKYQGWKGWVHGGIIATLLDEAMTRLASMVCGAAVSAELIVRYVAPAPIGEKLLIRGEIVKESRKLVETKAIITDVAGRIIAHSTGKVMKIS